MRAIEMMNRALRESTNDDIIGKKWSQLTDDDQRKRALELFKSDDSINDIFSEIESECLQDEIKEACNEAANHGVRLEPESVLVEDCSQGWYFPRGRKPDPKFDVFEVGKFEVQIDEFGYDYNRNCIYPSRVEGEYWNDQTQELVQFAFGLSPKSGEVQFDTDFPGFLREPLQKRVTAATKLMDDLVGSINDHMTSYMDDEWVREVVESNDYEVYQKPDPYADYEYDYDDDDLPEEGL